MPEPRNDSSPATPTRRTVLTALGASAAAAVVACVAVPAAGAQPLARPAATALPDPRASATTLARAASPLVQTPQTLAQARARAVASIGLRRGRSPWAALAPSGPWNAAHTAWIVDPSTQGEVDAQAIYTRAIAAGDITTVPRVGAIAFYEIARGQLSHVAFVETVSDRGTFTIAGDVGAPVPSDQTFVRRFVHPRGQGPVFLYPTYAG